MCSILEFCYAEILPMLDSTPITVEFANEINRLFMLGLAVYREARGEPFQGKLLVAQTIENRVQDKRWPDNYVSVITQPWQFSAFNKGDANVTVFPKENDLAWTESLRAAAYVIYRDDKVTTANHYFAKSIPLPKWADLSKRVDEYGGHVFLEL